MDVLYMIYKWTVMCLFVMNTYMMLYTKVIRAVQYVKDAQPIPL
jgi:hypothetical protein